jgi:DNA primase
MLSARYKGTEARDMTYGKRHDGPSVDHVAEAIARLDAGIAELATSEGWARWLATQSKFHHYSFGNVCLIAAQTGGRASRVAGFQTWKQLGRCVRKGEKAIWILAPMVRKVTEDDDDEPHRVVTGFRGAAVFDVAQTDGAPLAEPVSKLDGDAPTELWGRLESVANANGYTVYQYTPTNGANGFTDPQGKRIVVDPSMAPAMRCKTLAHELGHMILHASSGGYQGTCRDVAELEAESVAYCVLQRAGIDAGCYSMGYVLNWQGGDDKARATLRASAAQIAKAARTIIDSVWAEPTSELAAAA